MDAFNHLAGLQVREFNSFGKAIHPNQMLRFLVRLVLIASLLQLPTTAVMSWFQEPLPNPFEPLSKSPEGSRTDSTAEVTTESKTAATTEPASTAPAEVGEANPAGKLNDAQGGGRMANAAGEFAQPIPVPAREDLLQAAYQKPFLIEIDAQIDGFFDWFISKSLEQAKQKGADVVIIKLTSPGGELETSLSIARKLQDIDWAKTVVWIPEKAISGGAIVALGADAIYMKKSAMFGDAGPIFMTPWGDIVDAEEKIVSYTAESIRLIAKKSGLPVEVAAAMADRKLIVYSATEKSTGLRTFLNESQIQRADVVANFEIGEAVPEAGNDRFLTVGATRAQQLMLCDETFESEANLLQRLSSEGVVRIGITRTDRWVYRLNRPWLTTLILILGIICLYVEMTVPGVTLPGLISLLSFGLFFWSHVLGGTATGLEIMLFLLGTFALFVEVFVLPGFGVFGIAGIAMVGLSLLMATQDFVIPITDTQWKQFEGNGLSILLAGIVVAIIIGVQVFWFDSIPGLSRLQLRPEELPVTAPATSLHPSASLERGARGVCQSDLRPSGKAMIDGMLVDVLSEGDYVEVGSEVSVIRIEGNIITVRKVTG